MLNIVSNWHNGLQNSNHKIVRKINALCYAQISYAAAGKLASSNSKAGYVTLAMQGHSNIHYAISTITTTTIIR